MTKPPRGDYATRFRAGGRTANGAGRPFQAGMRPPQNGAIVGGTKRRIRDLVASLLEASVPKMERWIEEIEREHGALVAFGCVRDLLEYGVPKLARLSVDAPEGAVLAALPMSPASGEKYQAELLALGVTAEQVERIAHRIVDDMAQE